MDLTSLISTIITSVAAIVAIIGGLLVSRVISLVNDQYIIKRQIKEINLNIEHKEQIYKELSNFLFEEDLNDFITLSNLKLLLKGYSLDKILKEIEYNLLSKEELEPYYKILLDIKDEVISYFSEEDTSYEMIEELIERRRVKLPERIEWYKLMLKAIVDYFNSPSFHSPYYLVNDINISSSLINHSDYKQKVREKEYVGHEIKILKKQREELKKSVNDYLQTKGVWVGIGVLIIVSFIGILYPATLLPYPKDAFNDDNTKLLLLTLFAVCLLLIFGYLIIYLLSITRNKRRIKNNKF